MDRSLLSRVSLNLRHSFTARLLSGRLSPPLHLDFHVFASLRMCSIVLTVLRSTLSLCLSSSLSLIGPTQGSNERTQKVSAGGTLTSAFLGRGYHGNRRHHGDAHTHTLKHICRRDCGRENEGGMSMACTLSLSSLQGPRYYRREIQQSTAIKVVLS